MSRFHLVQRLGGFGLSAVVLMTAVPPSGSAESFGPPRRERGVLEDLAVRLAASIDGVALPDGNSCPRDRLRVSWGDPGPGFSEGAHLEPVGPEPGPETTQVNGVVLCEGSRHGYLGFEATWTEGGWVLLPTPTAGDDEPVPGDARAGDAGGEEGGHGEEGHAEEGHAEHGASPHAPIGPVPPGPAPFGAKRSVSSTAYCDTGRMANGEHVHAGAVAMNSVAMGTRWKVLDGPLGGGVFEVKDRIGHGSEFDVWVPSCDTAKQYGRHQVDVQLVSFGPAIDGYAPYEPQRTCDPAPKPGVLAFRAMALSQYPSSRNLGVSRACSAGGRSEHKEGRAFDWGVLASRPEEHAAAEQLVARLLAEDEFGNRHALARRMGVMYIIWNRRIWSASRADAGWRAYTGPNGHVDHVHVSFSWAGARGETSYWSGNPVATGLHGFSADSFTGRGGGGASPTALARPAPADPGPGHGPGEGDGGGSDWSGPEAEAWKEAQRHAHRARLEQAKALREAEREARRSVEAEEWKQRRETWQAEWEARRAREAQEARDRREEWQRRQEEWQRRQEESQGDWQRRTTGPPHARGDGPPGWQARNGQADPGRPALGTRPQGGPPRQGWQQHQSRDDEWQRRKAEQEARHRERRAQWEQRKGRGHPHSTTTSSGPPPTTTTSSPPPTTTTTG